MKDCLNLHCHEIKIESYDWKVNSFNNQIIIQSNQKFKLDVKQDDYLFAVKCSKCKEFNNEYKSNFLIQDIPVSLFCRKNTKKDIESNNKIKCYEFIEFNDFF